ncbi:Putative non-heme bromoperoxidase BpoC [Variovorax sp. PBL-H6]|uniref:alpha/beta fold hydrolase n=1 Tax=Variovorax sp. PBL-H6 TaxID=434009 RepID=UPI0013161637|nr:alpha/beta hydrolase [Variovorax sp. PBL-H6]VTU35733.1 Putative non-heme bromoperoxidase BpoC [Variovorax sp. PBL-H6]
MKLTANGLQIEVEDSGGEGRPVVLLIMGLGMQLIAWPDEFVRALVDAGFRVVRHDNRDIGLSQGFDHAATGNLLWQSVRHRIGLPVRSVYSLQDMAEDALGVLDALGIRRAHVLGASMGGMIAQRLAVTAPQRTTSLVSIMSSSGARNLPGPRPDVAAALMRRPASRTEAALVAHSLGVVRLIASPAYPEDERTLTERISRGLRRAYRPAGIVRQMLAIGADSGRDALLGRISSPTLVLHGDADPLVPIACGQDTARRISDARFVALPGMGHDLPPPVCDILLQHIVPFVQTAEKRA